MKVLENKPTTIKQGETVLTYKDLIFACVNAIPQGGVTPQDMKDRIRLLSILDKEPFEFEDADFGKLRKLAEQMKWAIVHKDIQQFYDDLENLKR